MERLSEKLCELINEQDFCFTHNEFTLVNKALKKFKDYEDAEEQGLLLRLPCTIGTTVWGLHEFSGGGRVPNWYEIREYNFVLSMLEEIGKTVFLTREEAESALVEKGE